MAQVVTTLQEKGAMKYIIIVAETANFPATLSQQYYIIKNKSRIELWEKYKIAYNNLENTISFLLF
jgi:F0F1-type ATP synthase alpha subunit